MTKLKPCPFCGGEASLVNSYDWRGNYSVVMCDNCYITGNKSYIGITKEANREAEDLWNRRYNED